MTCFGDVATKALASIVLLAGCSEVDDAVSGAIDGAVALACEGVVYGRQVDTFLMNTFTRQVHWVDEDQTVEMSRLDRGLIVFAAPFTREGWVEEDAAEGDERLVLERRFELNRISGRLRIYQEGKEWGTGTCKVVDPVI